MTLKYYDFVKSSSSDYMHDVLLGVTKDINLWTSGSNSKDRFSISSNGTQNIEFQINIVQKMPFLLLPIEDSIHKAFAAKMQRTSEASQNYTGTLSGSMPVGSNIKMHFSDDIYAQRISKVQFEPSKRLCYRRICLRGFTVHTEAYSRVSVRTTYTVKYYDSGNKMSCCGSILYYIHAKKCECLENICSCDSSLVAVLRKAFNSES